MHRRLKRQPVQAALGSALALTAVILVGGCSGTASQPTDSSASSALPSGVGLIKTIPQAQRGQPLQLSGAGLSGGSLDVSAFRGKVLVINIWGSWCGGCRGEADGLESVATKSKAQGVEFLGIDTRDLQTAQPQQFIKDHKISYPSFYDPTGDLLLKFPKGLFSPEFIPTTLVLDRQGRPASVAMRAISGDELTQMIAPVLAEKAS
jgi:thiol-disulfide isomerase/thioredoxin